MTCKKSPDYSTLSIDELNILALSDISAAWEIVRREKEVEFDCWEEDCDPGKGICYCGFCFDPNDEEDYQPTQVWFTESPCGHNGWE